ncbi:MAG: hypothetical protein A2Y73_07430 [Chloroflexi bacterium RBG_13_56_8]|nr:MAG: hypothetical protein A2Y73_07430 [Chloroflexi bacterium RBG_13_56_8]
MEETHSGRSVGFLDKPIFAGVRLTWWHVAWFAILVFVVFTRLWDLGSRPYCHDESIHAWESWKLFTGQGYIHDPVYHGPFMYHFTALIFTLFGDNDFTGRLGTALFGIVLTILPLFLRKWLGKVGVLTTMLLMAISPVMMYRYRYIRHDPAAIVFNLILFIAILRYLDRRKLRDLYLAAAALSLSFCGKETSFITVAILGTFLFGLFLWQWLREKKAWPDLATFDLMIVIGTLTLPFASPFAIVALGGDPLNYLSQESLLFSAGVFLVMLGISVAVGLWWNWRRWLVCAGIFYGICIPLFTTMFTNGQGFATGIVGSLSYWPSQQGVGRGDQPWFYYLVLMPLYEFLPLVAGVGGTVYYLLRKITRREEGEETHGVPFIPMIIYWSFLAFAIYSWAGERMPWLTMHIAFPWQILAGWAIARLLKTDWAEIRAKKGLWLLLLVPLFIYTLVSLVSTTPFTGTTIAELSASMGWLASLIIAVITLVPIVAIVRGLGRSYTWRVVATSFLIILLALTLRFAWMTTFINAGMANEFLVYAQGTPDVALVSHELESMSRRLTGDLDLKVAYDDEVSWPFVWYLRNFPNAQFVGDKPAGPLDADVILVGTGNEAGIKHLLGNKYYRRQHRLIWWPLESWYKGMTLQKLWSDLKDPVTRGKYWDVIWSRKYEYSLTAWPYVQNFAMYIKRDLVQRLWDYGPETLVEVGTFPGDEYVEKWKSVTAVAAWGSPGDGPGQMRAPKGLALDAEGNLYVVDSQNHRIQVFDAQGNFLRAWGSEGTQPGEFKEPWGVAVSPSGEVYVADTWNHRIQVFDQTGAFVRMWGVFGETSQLDGAGNVFYGPRGLAFDSQGNLYVADTGNKRIIKYDPQGEMIAAVGGMGDGDGQLQEPVGIAIDQEGDLYVADTWNQRVQVFDSQLTFLRKWPVYAWEGMSVVSKPYLAVSNENHVYVTDPEGYRIIEFDQEGKLLSVWGQLGADLSSMNLPTGIAVDADGRVFVADSDNHRVLVFPGN